MVLFASSVDTTAFFVFYLCTVDTRSGWKVKGSVLSNEDMRDWSISTRRMKDATILFEDIIIPLVRRERNVSIRGKLVQREREDRCSEVARTKSRTRRGRLAYRGPYETTKVLARSRPLIRSLARSPVVSGSRVPGKVGNFFGRHVENIVQLFGEKPATAKTFRQRFRI